MLSIITKIPYYRFFRFCGFPHLFPLNLTLSFSYKCNSRCKTCNIYKKESEELSQEEWDKIFKSIGRNIFWVTISGGEPFLREDLYNLICSLYENCRPTIINIPTNGTLEDRTIKIVQKVATYYREAQIVVNVSIDEIGERHDAIRGCPGSYEKALDTFLALKSIDLPNLSVGIHTVISKFNVKRIPQIYTHLQKLGPNSYITEIAEERNELNTVGADITPEYNDYAQAIDFLISKLKDSNFNHIGKITRAFRIEYYKVAKRILSEQKQIIPCYSGFASAQIAPDGNVWMCCIKANSIGNLRDVGYNFRKLWFSKEAEKSRKSIKSNECFCPLANASYTNMLFNLYTLSKVAWNLVRMS